MELVAVVPLLLALVLGLGQLAVAGYALWSAGEAARAGARAAHVGADPGAAARGALPAFLAPVGIARSDGGVRVEVNAPALLPGTPSIPVAASAALDPADTVR